jgi:C4-dicarboxylate-specific signal transduction histidine kinase
MFRNLFNRLSGHIQLLHALIILLMVGAMLCWQAWQRSDSFKQHHLQLATTSVTGATEDLDTLFSELQRSMRLFADDQQSLFEAIAAQPDNDALWDQLEKTVRNYFPEYFALTLTNATGNALRPDFDNLVDEVCQLDIHAFIAQGYQRQGYIHPNPLGYHFDFMVPWGNPEQPQGVFFLSFYPDMVARSLQRMQLPQHELLLLRTDQPGLIEITAQGARSQLERAFFLDAGELARISHTNSIPATRWDVVDLPAQNLYRDEAARNWSYAAIAFTGFASIVFLMLQQLRRKEQHRIDAEAQALQHQSDLAHVDRLNIMGEMASGLAHEINQPLTAISTYCQAGLRLINSPEQKPEKLAHALEQASLQAQRAGKIVHRMRRFGSKGKARRTAMDINKVILNAVSFVDPDLTRQNICRQLELADSLPVAIVDGIQIEQVVINLLHNAIEATAKSNTGTPALTISSHRMDDTIKVTIHDNGPGLDETMINTIFDAFYSTKTEGMGLGLAISRSIIEAHGGHLKAESQPGAGTTFYFTLPLTGT